MEYISSGLSLAGISIGRLVHRFLMFQLRFARGVISLS